MDLANLDAAEASEAVFDLELRHPVTKEPLRMFIAHKGANCRAVLDLTRRQANQMLRESFQAQRKAKDIDAPTVEETGKRTAKVLTAATVDWYEMKDGKRVEGFEFGGKRLKFSADEAQRLYDNDGFAWLRGQLDDSVSDLGNFMKP